MGNLEYIPPHERERLFQKEVDAAKAYMAKERAALTGARTRRELVELFAGSSHPEPVANAMLAYKFITEEISE